MNLSRQIRPDEMAQLAAQRRDEGPIRHVKDAGWFRWRYRDPSSRYLFVYFERDARLVGYMVLHRDAAPLPAGPLYLVDWEREEQLAWSEFLGVATRVADRLALPLMAWSAALPAVARQLMSDLHFVPRPIVGPLASRRPTFLVGRIGDAGRPATPRAGGNDDDAWTVGGRRIDDPDCWDLRPVFADRF